MKKVTINIPNKSLKTDWVIANVENTSFIGDELTKMVEDLQGVGMNDDITEELGEILRQYEDMFRRLT